MVLGDLALAGAEVGGRERDRGDPAAGDVDRGKPRPDRGRLPAWPQGTPRHMASRSAGSGYGNVMMLRSRRVKAGSSAERAFVVRIASPWNASIRWSR